MKRNIWFIFLFIGLIFTYCCRYTNVDTDVVWNSDSELAFSTDNEVLEQTWQPSVKMISGVTVPCYSDADFECDLNLKIFNDNYSEILVDTTLEKYVFEKDNSNKITFTFAKTKVIPGERYRFQITCHNPSANATLMIASGTNYGGCSIDHVDTGEGAAFGVTTVKYSKLFWLVSILLPVCAISLLFMLLFDRKLEETVGLAMALEGLTIYVFSLFEHLEMGIYAIYFLSVISLIASVVICNLKKKEWKELVSPGMVIFFVFFVIILLTSYGDWLGTRDDMKHWGMAVRDMFYYNTHANHINSTMLLQRYFPFATIMEYVFVYMNGMFSENLLLIAFQFLMLCELVILTKPLQSGLSLKRILPVLVMMVCVPATYFTTLTGSIMVDPFQMSVMVYVLVCFLSESLTGFNILRICCGLVVLTVTKDIGIVFSGIIAFILFVDIAVKQIREKKLVIKQLLFPICSVFLVLFAYFSWQIYLSVPNQTGSVIVESNQSNIASGDNEEIVDVEENAQEESRVIETGISASGITLQGIKDLLSGNGKEYQYEVIDKYIVALFEGEDFSLGGRNISFYKVIAFILTGVFVLGYFGFWGDRKDRVYIFYIAFFLSSLLLVCFLLVTYLFAFPQGHAVVLSAMGRYLGPYICTMIICSLFILYDNYENHKYGALVLAVLSVVLAINMPIQDLVVECNERPEYSIEKNTYGYDRIAAILRSVAKRGEKVQYICSGGDGYNEYLFRNAVCPLISFHQWNDIVSDRDIYNKYAELALQQEDQGDLYNPEIVSYEELSGRLQEVQYVVIFHADDSFVESYADLFGGPQMISDGCIYSVEENSEGIVCNLIGKTGIKGWRKK